MPAFEHAVPLDDLDLDALPEGQVTRARVAVLHDGLGRAMEVPVVIVRGARPGPTLGLTAALHGNEINGIPVIHKLIERTDPEKLRGTLAAALVCNIPGYIANIRHFGKRDLNHLFPGKPAGATPHVLVHRLLERIVSHFDLHVDLHTASFGRVNSLYVRADLSNRAAARMAYLQRPQIIVHNPPSDHTLRGAAMERGIPSITVEIGNPQVFQKDYIRRSLLGLRAVMMEAGMIPRRSISMGPAPIICERSFWLYTDSGGLLEVFPEVTQALRRGEVIARLHNIYGDLLSEYTAPEGGVVVGKSVNPVGPTGSRILHLGIKARKSDKRFHKATTPGPLLPSSPSSSKSTRRPAKPATEE